MENNNIRLMKGFVSLNNFNSLGNFYYSIRRPLEITNGNWGCRIAFFSRDKLLYHSKDTFAHQLPPYETFNVVYFSKNNTVALYYEVKVGIFYNIVLIDSKNQKCYKRELEVTENFDFKKMTFDFENSDIDLFINEYKFIESELKKNKLIKSIFCKWYK